MCIVLVHRLHVHVRSLHLKVQHQRQLQKSQAPAGYCFPIFPCLQ